MSRNKYVTQNHKGKTSKHDIMLEMVLTLFKGGLYSGEHSIVNPRGPTKNTKRNKV